MLLSMSSNLSRSTMDFFQSSFSEFFAAKPSRMAATSTVCTGVAAGSEVAAGAAVAGETGEAAGVVAEGAVADAIVVLGGACVVEVAAPACPNIFDIRLLNIPIGALVRSRAVLWMHLQRYLSVKRSPEWHEVKV